MTDNFIQLGKSDVLRLEIKTNDGKTTGNYLEFNLEDIELPLKYQELLDKNKKNQENLRNQLLIIEKRQDVKGKKLMSKNEEDKIKAIRDYVNKEIEVYNMFLGENGVQKLLNGEKPTWFIFEKIDKIIKEQIMPHLESKMIDIDEKIKNKYKQVDKDEIEVVE